jgi:CRISPR-associated protein Cas2
MVYGANNEQGLAFEAHGHGWVAVDFEDVHLMLRPAQRATPTKTGWSRQTPPLRPPK